MINIYEQSGYLNIAGILQLKQTFNFIIGGRGTGKTYGALKTVIDSGRKLMLMRRTQSQTDLINKPEFSPFKPIANDMHINIEVSNVSKYNSKIIIDDVVIGYTCALSTISNMRGFSAEDIDILIYDEFIPERHERPIKNEGSAFLNAYETINRNRELQGKKPLQVLCLANAFDIANPIFLELGLVGIAEKMKQREQQVYINREKSISIIMPDSERIRAQKAKTALYKLTKGSNYADMALSNDFVYNSRDNIQSLPLKELKPLTGIGELYIYKHKSKSLYYISEHASGNVQHFNTDEADRLRFLRKYGVMLRRQYLVNRIRFENVLTKSLFEYYII